MPAVGGKNDLIFSYLFLPTIFYWLSLIAAQDIPQLGRDLALGQKWDPFGSHFVHMQMLHVCYRKWDPNGSRNREFARRESETNKKISCTGPHVTFWKIDIISSNLTKDEQNRPSGSRDMAVYFHGLIQKNWWFWVNCEKSKIWNWYLTKIYLKLHETQKSRSFARNLDRSLVGTLRATVEHEMGPKWVPFLHSSLMTYPA